MKRRRRRFFREEVLAPWVSIAVIGTLWWAGASLIGSSAPAPPPATSALRPPAADRVAPAVAPPQPREAPVADAPETHAVLRSPGSDGIVAVPVSSSEIQELQSRRLTIPVQGVAASQILSNYHDDRGQGRKHEALDILSPRGTPVVAVEDGHVAKIFTSARGGLTIYQFDPTQRYCYYYAHLDSYAEGLAEGQKVKRGQTIGYVGTSGNAPENTPHLHFAITRLGADPRWWEGEPLDPALVLR
jgi:peptidoglycan LD-endopeptidase LytH